jgi:hypothetical protein
MSEFREKTGENAKECEGLRNVTADVELPQKSGIFM